MLSFIYVLSSYSDRIESFWQTIIGPPSHIYYLAFYRKSLPIPNLDSSIVNILPYLLYFFLHDV